MKRSCISVVLIGSLLSVSETPITVTNPSDELILQAVPQPLRWSGRQPLVKTHQLFSESNSRKFRRREAVGLVAFLMNFSRSLFAQSASSERERVRGTIRSWLEDPSSSRTDAMASVAMVDPEVEIDFLDWLLLELKTSRPDVTPAGRARENALLYILGRRLENSGREKLLKVIEVTRHDDVRETGWRVYGHMMSRRQPVDSAWTLTGPALQLLVDDLQNSALTGVAAPLVLMALDPTSNVVSEKERLFLGLRLRHASRESQTRMDPVALETLSRILHQAGLPVWAQDGRPSLVAGMDAHEPDSLEDELRMRADNPMQAAYLAVQPESLHELIKLWLHDRPAIRKDAGRLLLALKSADPSAYAAAMAFAIKQDKVGRYIENLRLAIDSVLGSSVDREAVQAAYALAQEQSLWPTGSLAPNMQRNLLAMSRGTPGHIRHRKLPYLSATPVVVQNGEAVIPITMHGAGTAPIAAVVATIEVAVIGGGDLTGVSIRRVMTGTAARSAGKVVGGNPYMIFRPSIREKIVLWGGATIAVDGEQAQVIVTVPASSGLEGKTLYLWITDVEAANPTGNLEPINPGNRFPWSIEDLALSSAGGLNAPEEVRLRRLKEKTLDPRLADLIDKRLSDLQDGLPSRPLAVNRRPSHHTALLTAS